MDTGHAKEVTLSGKPIDRERMLDVWLGLTGQAPLPAGPLILPVLSGSMRPAIPLGSQIRIEPWTDQPSRVGDVIVYLAQERLVAHRMLWQVGSRCFMKGDANPWGHWIPRKRFRGRVAEVIPPGEDGCQNSSPHSREAALASRREFLRDLVLVIPRFLRDTLAGKREDTP